jgi:hypothetical protein
MDLANRTALHAILTAHFTESGLRQLCFALGIDYEDLAGRGKSDNARALVEYAERHGRINELVRRVRELRPQASWQAVQQTADLSSNRHPQLADLPLDSIPDVATLPPGSFMPLAPNPLFVGRAENLMALARVLKAGGTAAIGGLAAATSLGGIGKTRLATEFAHRYGQYFAGGVFWLSFADAAGVGAAVAQCGGAAGLALRPDFASLPLDYQVALVLAAWQSPLARLLIFDNCEDEALLDTWRPKSGGCRVLIASRRPIWDASLGVQTHALDTLPRAESMALLRKFRPDLPKDDADLDAVAAELGDLPLALHLAGSFLKHAHAATTPAEYLAELRGAALLDHESLQGLDLTISPTNHPLHVARTFALSFDRLDPTKAIDSLALALLARAACFAPGQPIPRDLLLATVELPDAPARRLASRAINRLIALGLVEAQTDAALRLHRLLASFAQDSTTDAIAQKAVEDALYATATQLNNAGYPAPLLELQAHLRYITTRAMRRQDHLAALLDSQGDDAAAKTLFERALAILERALGPEHPHTRTIRANLAALTPVAAATPPLPRAGEGGGG